MVSELWGSLMSDDLQFEAKNNQDCIKQYVKYRNMGNVKVVYDSKKNHIESSQRVIAVQQGWYNESLNITFIRGKRYFYKIVSK